MCLGCREHKDKKELVRVVRSPEGEVSVDLTGRKNGRGAYICRTGDCFEKTKKKRQLEKSFKCSISPEVYLMIEKNLE